MASAYEQMILDNRRKNAELLRGLGVPVVLRETLSEKEQNDLVEKKKKLQANRKRALVQKLNAIGANGDSNAGDFCRRSDRLLGKEPVRYNDVVIINEVENVKRKIRRVTSSDFSSCRLDPSTYAFKKPVGKRENVYGSIEGVPIGTIFQSRMECSYAGIHRPTVAGIHGGPDGAYSVVLNGGYAEDVDMGDRFTYTGAGGRDLKGTKQNPKNLRTAPQTKDQTLTGPNLALKRNVESGLPVRVVRGYKNLEEKYAPSYGYRYDGLYSVEKCFSETSDVSGLLVYHFAMLRCPGQPQSPWEISENETVDVKMESD